MALAAAAAAASSAPTFSNPVHLRRLHRIAPSSPSRFRRLHRQFDLSQTLICSACEELGSVFDFLTNLNDAVAVENFQTRKIVVLGGSGFVGSAICKAAVGYGFDVVSLSRSGRPPCKDAWVNQTVWIAGDVFYTDWDNLFNGATAAVSAIGGFGTNEQMEKLNSEANLLAINAALNAGIQKFVFVSVHDYNVPNVFKSYFDGKRKAEVEVLAKFANAGTVLRPGFIYGRKTLNGLQVPLDVVGGVWEWVHAATQFLTRPFTLLPASDLVLAPPVSVNDVAAAAIKAVIDDDVFGIYTIEQIKDLASSM